MNDGSTESARPALGKAPIASTFRFPGARPAYVPAEPEPPKSARVTPEEKIGERMEALDKFARLVAEAGGDLEMAKEAGMLWNVARLVGGAGRGVAGAARAVGAGAQAAARTVSAGAARGGGMMASAGKSVGSAVSNAAQGVKRFAGNAVTDVRAGLKNLTPQEFTAQRAAPMAMPAAPAPRAVAPMPPAPARVPGARRPRGAKPPDTGSGMSTAVQTIGNIGAAAMMMPGGDKDKNSGEDMKNLLEKIAAAMPQATQEEKLEAVAAIAANMGFEDVVRKEAEARGLGVTKTASEEGSPVRKVKFNKLSIDDLVHHLSDEFGRPEWHEKEAAHYPTLSKFAKLLEVERTRPS